MKTIRLITLSLLLPLSTLTFNSSLAGNTELTTKEEFVEKLTPKPVVKTRSIRLNGQQAANEAAPAPKVSMQINFEHDSYELTAQSKEKLQPLGEALVSDELLKYHFNIAGHTDATGSDAYNQTLSGKRAVAVGQFLYDNFGIDPARLKLSGHGEKELLDTENPNSEVNRRVEITTLVQSASE
ncbi:MAG: OmpA family protein [Arenicella sp.]